MTISPFSNEWSDSLKAQTRDVIEGHGLFAMRDGRLYLKHAVSGFGTMVADDLQRGVLRVVDMRTKQEMTFATVDELIVAGWAID
jgi:hypothetical protein